jgi:hypothetical protein
LLRESRNRETGKTRPAILGKLSPRNRENLAREIGNPVRLDHP